MFLLVSNRNCSEISLTTLLSVKCCTICLPPTDGRHFSSPLQRKPLYPGTVRAVSGGASACKTRPFLLCSAEYLMRRIVFQHSFALFRLQFPHCWTVDITMTDGIPSVCWGSSGKKKKKIKIALCSWTFFCFWSWTLCTSHKMHKCEKRLWLVILMQSDPAYSYCNGHQRPVGGSLTSIQTKSREPSSLWHNYC